MVYFNDKKIEVYELDSVTTVLRRVCAMFDTIPRLITFETYPTIENLNSNDNIPFTDIRYVLEPLASFEEAYNKLQDTELTIDQIVSYYLIFSKQFDQIEKLELEAENSLMAGIYIEPILLEIEQFIKNQGLEFKGSLKTIWNNRYGNGITIEGEIQKNKKISNGESIVFKKFSDTVGLPYTDFTLEKIRYELTLDIEKISILEMFNRIKLNSKVPFATTHYFYKILKNSIPMSEWSNLFDRSKSSFDKYKNIDRNKNIILKVLQRDDIYNTDSDFTEGILTLKDSEYLLKLTHNTRKLYIPQEKLTSNVLNVIGDPGITNSRDIDVNGVFYIPNQTMNKYVMMDIIMNDPMFSSIMYIDETSIGIKPSVFVHFESPKVGNVNMYFTEQVVQRKPPIEGEDKVLFVQGKKYLRVKISRCESLEKVKYFQELLSKLLVIYNDKYPEILGYYESNYVDINMEDIIEKQQYDLRLKDIDPYIFKPLYTRICRSPLMYVPDSLVEKYKKQGKKLLEFPKEQIGDSIPRWYKCEDESKYPGLRINPFDNYKEVPYIPCCYKKDQSTRKGSYYRNYYFGEPVIEKDTKQKGIYVSKAIIPRGALGTLPAGILSFFAITDLDGIYYRKGVDRGPSSLLSCIADALKLDISDLERERANISTYPYAASCKQELYDLDISTIAEKIANPEEYLDPKLFIRLIENVYKCSIYIFGPDDGGVMLSPRYINGRYTTKSGDKPVIFLYEHMGADTERNTYPQCELIIRQTSEGKESVFQESSSIGKSAYMMLENITQGYSLTNKIIPSIFNPFVSDIYRPVSQVFDSYGKVRILNFENRDGEKVSLLTNPLQPYVLFAEAKEYALHRISMVTALELVNELNLQIEYQVLDKYGVIKELYCSSNIIIPIDDMAGKIASIPVLNPQDTPSEEVSVLKRFNLHKKFTRYIIEYMYWLFSQYLEKEGITTERDITDIVYSKFADNNIAIIGDFVYTELNKEFSMESQVMENSKLVVKSQETLKRLLYVLRLAVQRNFAKIRDYKNIQTIQEYYLDITDFDTSDEQILLEGESSVDKWIKDRNKEYKLQLSFNNNKSPQFLYFKNKVYLAQNTDTLEKAASIAEVWSKQGYNTGSIPTSLTENKPDGLLYIPEGTEIKEYELEGDHSYIMHLIGYKINDQPVYSVLLSPK